MQGEAKTFMTRWFSASFLATAWLKSCFSWIISTMSKTKLVASLGDVDQLWGAALKESGFRVLEAGSSDEVLKSQPDFVLVDTRKANAANELVKLKSKVSGPILSLIGEEVNRDELVQLKQRGVSGYVAGNTPPEEVVLRVQAMLQPSGEKPDSEARSAKRVWFQQKVKFKIFEKDQTAWSTTLSETGIFLRTALSFPLYSVMHLSFYIWGEGDPFECDGVIVRQEVDSELKGLGVMFQNLKGENIHRLESFLELYQ